MFINLKNYYKSILYTVIKLNYKTCKTRVADKISVFSMRNEIIA